MRRLIKSDGFKKFDELAFKLLVYFCKVRSNKDLTPWTTIDDLSVLVDAGWKRTKRSLTRLLEIGVIRQESQRRSTRFCLVFKDPYAHEQEQGTDTAGQTPLRSRKADSRITGTATATATKTDVHLYASVEGRSPSSEYVKTADRPDQFGTQSCPKRQASSDDSPAWVTERDETAHHAGYVPGQDAELSSLSERGLS